ncbi:hypothetical protein E2C01_009050 [Portunus trituberculatus]|uniref:Uncharacterized protein n=1 Tax=Portunus trituberculatus TaxID=210409 RepID=A0A5B7D3M5_PORTR|nr:hypothetical protein [Portunus trituberculatus]
MKINKVTRPQTNKLTPISTQLQEKRLAHKSCGKVSVEMEAGMECLMTRYTSFSLASLSSLRGEWAGLTMAAITLSFALVPFTL